MEKRMPVIGKAWLKDENEITQWITSKEAEKYRTENWSKGSASDWESGEQINFNELSRKMPGVYDALKHGTEGGSWLKKLLEHMDVLPENWQVTLTEWRHENSYHKLTPARAKSFVGLLKDKTN